MLCDRDIMRQHARDGTVVRGHTRSFRLSVSANILEGEPLLYETFSVGGRRAHEETHGETDVTPSGVWQAVLLYGRTVWNVECARRDVLSTVRADLVP